MSESPVTSFAVGKAGRVAALSGAHATLFDGTRWMPIEPAFDFDTAHVSIFFGRDNEPRVMGYSGDGASLRARYFRRVQARWVDGSSELGGLAAARGALYGVLGQDDPEVVCVASRSCIVKRTTGWTNVPAHPEPTRIAVSGGRAWALHREHIDEQVERGWTELAPARHWNDPVSLWLEPGGTPWVVESNPDAIRRLRDGQWALVETPVRRPRALSGTAGTDVWIAGESAARYDGAEWRCVHAVRDVEFALGNGRDVWFAGASGVWRVRQSKTSGHD
jgi:hypothetical protein